jgi:glutamate-ammonia-ligase adenylyltransferase
VAAEDLKDRIKSLCPEVSSKVVADFFSRMDEDYFATFSPEEIATHIRMSVALDPRHRVQVRITPARDGIGHFDIVIVAFDYPSEFSIFCGLISAFGLDIRAGNVYSFGKSEAGISARKIVDVFSVGVRAGEVFDESRQRQFEEQLQSLAQLLATGGTDQARERLNRFLTEQIEKMNEPLSGLVHPIQIRFDNDASTEWTVMEAHSEDAYALLYAISNALALQGIYIHGVKIRSSGHEAHDRFMISDRWGRKIQDPAMQERLRTEVAMIKQFTRFLPVAPDPARAMRHFDQFLDKMADEKFPDHVMTFLAGSDGMNLLAHLLGSSDYLWDDLLRIHFLDLLPLLERFARRGTPEVSSRDSLRAELRSRTSRLATFEEKKVAFNRFKDDQLFLIDVQHLLTTQDTLIDFSESVTDLAEVVIDEALRVCAEQMSEAMPGLFTVCGLGKFGGREMGYASDLELIFVHEERTGSPTSYFESLARRIIEFIEARRKGIFEIDLRLRPYGDFGAWSTPFDEFKRYYSSEGAAAPFERQALIKLRCVAGDVDLGRRVTGHRDSFTYSGLPWDSQNALHLRRRQMRELVKHGETNVKSSAGGLIDIEYAAQYLQLLHGHVHPELRVTNTLQALERLRRLGFLDEREYGVLQPGYLFLRSLINALRIVRGDAGDLLLPELDSDDFKSLARRLGYREHDRTAAARHLADEIRQCMKRVHTVFIERFDKSS